MACPLSFSDILAISRTCYTICKKLTIGRVEAVKEFEGVRSQLSALGESLKHLDAEVNKPDSIFAQGDTAKMALTLIQNCSVRLDRFEDIVEKYREAMENEGSLRDFAQGFRDNWMRVMWMKEKKELTALTTDLTLHTSAINSFITTTNSAALGNINTTTINIERNALKILDGIQKLLSESTGCASRCDKELSAAPLTTFHTPPQSNSHSRAIPHPPSRVHHPGGLPYVSAQRCSEIDDMSFELEISEEREDGKYVICPSAQLKGFHFMAPQRPGNSRGDLFQCNCKAGRLRSALSNNGHHTKQLKDYSCGSKTFIAQSYLKADSGWWLLKTESKLGGYKNLFLELKEINKRPQFAKIVASMLRTNVARNVINEIIKPFDLVRQAKNGPKPYNRLQIVWSYEERTVGRKGIRIHIENSKSPCSIDKSEKRYLFGKTVQDYFTNPLGFSWYRVATFESINIPRSFEDNDLEDAYFFLDHFHTSVELKVQLSDPRDPKNISWGVGEFGGADPTYFDKPNNDELMLNISRFTVEKGEDWKNPRPVNCSLYLTLRPGSSDAPTEMYNILKQYETLSGKIGYTTEFSHTRPETPTKENPKFLMRIKNAIFTDISTGGKEGPASLDRHGFDSTRTFRDCWLLGRRSDDNPESPLQFIIRSVEQDILCHIYLSAKDSRSLRRSEGYKSEIIPIELYETTPMANERSKSSWGLICLRNPYDSVTPPGINICGSLKLEAASESDLDNLLGKVQQLLDIYGGPISKYEAHIPPYKESFVSEDTSTRGHIHTIINELPTKTPEVPTEKQYSPVKSLPPRWDTNSEPSGNYHNIESHVLVASNSSDTSIRRSNTFSLGSGSSHFLKERATSWSIGQTPTVQNAIQPQLFRSRVATIRPGSMFVVTQGEVWGPPSPRYAIPEYQPHPKEPNQIQYQQHQETEVLSMPDADQFANSTSNFNMSRQNIDDNPHPGRNNNSYNHRLLAGKYRNISVPRSPQSEYLESFQPTLCGLPTFHTPESSPSSIPYPQQRGQALSNHIAGIKRFATIHDYKDSSANYNVPPRAGQMYCVAPQPDNPPYPRDFSGGYSHTPPEFTQTWSYRDYHAHLGPKL